MARTLSNMIELGTRAPDFKLFEPLTDEWKSLESLKSDQGTVIIFLCNHCPFVIHIQDQLVDFIKRYQDKGISFIGINSNDVDNYPDDSPEKMVERIHEKQFSFPYLFDESQEVAKAYDAACTPDFYFFGSDLELVYRGQFDAARPGNDEPVTGESLGKAIDQYLQDGKVDMTQMPSMGCNIKWK